MGFIVGALGPDFVDPRAPSPRFFYLLAAAALALSILLPFTKYILSQNCDPNGEDIDARKRLGQARAVSKADSDVSDCE